MSYQTVLIATLTLLLPSQVLAQSEAEAESGRDRAIESVRASVDDHPDDRGLRHALECLKGSGACSDRAEMERALESVHAQHQLHPHDAGLAHAERHLERHHARLQRADTDRSHNHLTAPSPSHSTPRAAHRGHE